MTEGGKAPDYAATLSAFARALPEPVPDYCLIGALALGVWGAVRATQDIDFLMVLDDARCDSVMASLATAGFLIDSRWAEPNPMAKDRFVRLAFGPHAVDLMFARDALHREALARKRAVSFEGLTIGVASAEDLMLLKLRAGRDQDFVDVVSVASRQGSALDLAYLKRWAERLGVSGELEYALKSAAT